MNPKLLFTIVVCLSFLHKSSLVVCLSLLALYVITSGDIPTENQETPNPNLYFFQRVIRRLISPEFAVNYHHLLTNYPRFSFSFLVLLILQVASNFSLGNDTAHIQLMVISVAFMMFKCFKFVFLLAAPLNPVPILG
ncbi:hypothetical protein PS1_029581 [Malus domestica]